MIERTKKFTNAEFAALARYPNGRIESLSEIFMWLTPSQVEKLHSDDWAYYGDLEEEVRIMAREFLNG
jgi:hypothetical protein